MKIIWILNTAIAVVTSLVCASYLRYACRPVPRSKLPLFSLVVIGLTFVVSALQFVYPELLAALQRDPQAIRSGQLWRLVTALFVQPNGVAQCVANGFLILAFMPATERYYGRNVLVIYFAAGLVGQTVNYFWNSGIGGSSTAIFGLMGSLLIYIIRNRKVLLLPFAFIAGLGLLASIVMVTVGDGHGVGLIIGALVATLLPLEGMSFRSRESNTFATPFADLRQGSG